MTWHGKRRVPPDKRRTEGAKPGQQLALKHGARARVLPMRQSAKEQEIYDLLAQDVPLRDGDQLPAADRSVVQLLAQTLCRLEDVTAWLNENGIRDGRGKMRDNPLRWESRYRNQALRMMGELGMTPRSRAKLGVDISQTFDLAKHWAAKDGNDGEESP